MNRIVGKCVIARSNATKQSKQIYLCSLDCFAIARNDKKSEVVV